MPTHDQRTNGLTERLTGELLDDDGHEPDPAHVAEIVEAKAAAFEDAPVQDFVPLLTEHLAREDLRTEGFRRDLHDGEPSS